MHASLKAEPTLRKLWLAAQARQDLTPTTRKLHFLQSLKCTNKYERRARALGATLIAGVDEVGRGALFGPVVAAAVILPEDFRLRGLRDSKQLTQEERERMATVVRKKALSVAIAEVDAATIDRVNIYQATRMAMLMAISQLSVRPDHLLVDAMHVDYDCAQTKLFYGDSLSISIAAASVIAKVHRDALVTAQAEEFPHYNLASNKGYSTPDHKRALREHGPCQLHRRTFAPVYLSEPDAQLDLLMEQHEPMDDVEQLLTEDAQFETEQLAV
jgi:ribonuclease HII